MAVVLLMVVAFIIINNIITTCTIQPPTTTPTILNLHPFNYLLHYPPPIIIDEHLFGKWSETHFPGREKLEKIL